MATVADLIFLGSKIIAVYDGSHEIKRHLLLGRKAMTNLHSLLKSRDITLLTKVHVVKSYVFSSSHVQMWELDHKEGWVLKNWCFWTVVLEETLESPLNCNEIKSVNPKGNQFWIFIGRTDAEAKAPVLWLRDSKSRLISKDPDAEKDWRQEEKGTTEDEMVEWPHDSMDMSLSELLEMVKDREVWHAAVYRVAKSWTWLSNWTANNIAAPALAPERWRVLPDDGAWRRDRRLATCSDLHA